MKAKYEIDQVMMVTKDYPDGAELLKGDKVIIDVVSSNGQYYCVSNVSNDSGDWWEIKEEDLIPYPKSAEEMYDEWFSEGINNSLMKANIIVAMEEYANQFK